MRACVLLGFVAVAIAAESKPLRWDFEDSTTGKLPSDGWPPRPRKEPAAWKVVEDSSAPKGSKVLAQTSSEGPNLLFNLCVVGGTSFADLDFTVSFKAVTGKKDQGGGVVWRYKDANNYYVARANPLEDNFRVYKVVDGKRTQLGTADVEAPAGKWHRLRIIHKGNRIQGFLNGKPYLDVKDDTFEEAGKVGLWTKADAVTHFDDLAVTKPGE